LDYIQIDTFLTSTELIVKIKSLALTIGIATIAVPIGGAFTPARSVSFLNTFSSPGTVGSIDSNTGIFTPVVTNGPSSLADIALDGSGQLYGNTLSELYRLNPVTNTSTLVGSMGAAINGLGFATNGNLYGTGGNNFYQVSTTTGATTQIGSSITNFNSAGDIVFNPDTNQFLATSLNPSNSTLFSIGLDGSASSIGSGIGFGNVYGIFFEGGQLFGYTDDRRQIKIDLATGTGTFDRNITGTSLTIGGAASLPSTGSTVPPVSIPPVSTPPVSPVPPVSTPPVASVPEPFTIIGTLTGGIAALRLRQKLKSADKG
jgi:hypothetical protein